MIRKALFENAAAVAQLAIQMWDDHSVSELIKDFETLISKRECVVFLCMEDEVPIGFAQCQLRRDYVEGTESSPVGYLEGIFVEEPYRHKGYARELVAACESWAREMGCTEFASDCELCNETSQAFHLKMGFTEANRIVCFKKNL